MTAHGPTPPHVIGDADTVRGFRLAGLSGTVVLSRDEAAQAFLRARDAGIELVVLTEEAEVFLCGAGLLPHSGRPVVAVVPAARGPRPRPLPAERLERRVRRALGLPVEREP